MNKFLIVANTDKDINLKLSQDIVAYIRKKGAQAVVVSDEQHYNGTTIKPEYMEGVEAVIVLHTVLEPMMFHLWASISERLVF